jgi:hypothetical protein
MNERSDETGGVRADESGFGDPPPTDADVNQAKLDEEAAAREQLAVLQGKMRGILEKALADLESGKMHGLVVVKVDGAHDVASGYALCSDAAMPVAMRLQDISMKLALPPSAVREIKGLAALLRGLGG